MADTSEVETAIVNFIGGIVYPNGFAQPSIIGPAKVKIYRGWPIAASLDTDLAAGTSNVSVFPPPGMEKNTTRYPRSDRRLTAPVHTLTASVAGNQITIGGTVAIPQNVIALCGQNTVFPYAVQAADTLDTIATNLAALISATFPDTSSTGNVITIADHPGLIRARVSSSAQVWQEQARQEKMYWITCWCPNPAARDSLASPIDVAIKGLDFITLPDGSVGRIRYESTRVVDDADKVQIYRRDLCYCVEFATAKIFTAPETGAIGVTQGPTGAQRVTYF